MSINRPLGGTYYPHPATPTPPGQQVAGAIQNQPAPVDLSQYYAQQQAMYGTIQKQMDAAYQQQLAYQNQLTQMQQTDPGAALFQQLLARYGNDPGAALNQQLLGAYKPVQQRSRAFTLRGY